jgi:cation transport ATPase
MAHARGMSAWKRPGRRAAVWLALALAGLAGGLGAWLAGADQLGDRLLAVTVVAGLLPLAVSEARALVRRQPGVDLIALLAMAGALALGRCWPGR